MTTMVTMTSRDRSLSRIDRIVRKIFDEERAAVIREIEQRLADRDRRIAEALGETRGTQADLIRGILASSPRSMTVREIARASGLDQSAVRATVYTRKSEFVQDTTAPSRPTRWCLSYSEVGHV